MPRIPTPALRLVLPLLLVWSAAAAQEPGRAAEDSAPAAAEAAYASGDESEAPPSEGNGPFAGLRSFRFLFGAYLCFFGLVFVYLWNLGRRQKRLVAEIQHLRRSLSAYRIDDQVNQS